MKTDFDTVLKLIQRNKAKQTAEGFTTWELADSIGKSNVQARRIIAEMIHHGLAMFAGKRPMVSITGVTTPIPIYKLIKPK